MIYINATIPSGEALSNEVNLSGLTLLKVVMPAAWTAASLGFKSASSVNGTFQPDHAIDDSLFEITVAAGRNYKIDPQDALGLEHLKVWSQTSGSDVNQGADRVVTLVCRRFE